MLLWHLKMNNSLNVVNKKKEAQQGDSENTNAAPRRAEALHLVESIKIENRQDNMIENKTIKY